MTQSTQFTEFTYSPGQPTPTPTPAPEPPPPTLGLLDGLQGSWAGEGFNAIWRPVNGNGGQDRFLELNRTSETIDFDNQGLGSIPNRGLHQTDLFMSGIRYLQHISDANTGDGLHIEPGLWLAIPSTTVPAVPDTIARLASIPHGTTIVAQGTSSLIEGPPTIPATNLNPFPIDNPAGAGTFPEQNLSAQTTFRTAPEALSGIDQPMVDNPNSVLETANSQLTIIRTVQLAVTTAPTPVAGGGTANTAFLAGDATSGPNAVAASVTATFWLETLEGQAAPSQLQYSQTVLLNFNGQSWPHVTVATLKRQPSVTS